MNDARELAFKVFNDAMQKCDSTDDISVFCQMLCTLSAKTIHGIEGRKFKKDFLRMAISDIETITPHRATNPH